MDTVGDDTKTYAFCPVASKAASFDVFAIEMLLNGLEEPAAEGFCSTVGAGEETVSSIGLLGIGGAVVGDSMKADIEVGAFGIPISLFKSISKSPT